MAFTIPSAVLVKMFDLAPKAFTAIILVGYGIHYGISLLYPPKTYDDGIQDGYKRAQEELRRAAKENIAKTVAYIECDAEDNAAVADKYFKEKISIVLLPRWTLKLLGDTYVVRRPLRADWNNAWFMTEADSQDMDKKIQDALHGTKFEMNDTAAGLAKGNIQEAIQRILEEEVMQCVEK